MSAAAIIAIAIAVVVVLGALTFVTLARRSRRARRRRAVERDPQARRRRPARRAVADEPVLVGAPTAAEVEAQGAVARYGTAVVPAAETAPAPWMPPDPEALGVTRRQFFNRATVTLMSAGLGAFAAAGFVAFLWPTATGGFGQQVTVGKLDDILETIRTGDGFFYAPAARTWITEYPADALAAARLGLPRQHPRRDGDRASSRSTRSARTSAAACPRAPPAAGSSAAATARSTTASVRRRPVRRRGAWTASRSRWPSNGDVTVDTGVVVAGPPIGTNTTGQEAEGPHCISVGGDH